MAGSDVDFPSFFTNNEESISYTNPDATNSVTVKLVVTGFNDSGFYDLDIRILGTACALGESRCNVDGNLETCNANANGFDVVDCPGGCAFDAFALNAQCKTFCGADTMLPGNRCDGTVAQYCSDDQTRYLDTTCAASCSELGTASSTFATCTFDVCSGAIGSTVCASEGTGPGAHNVTRSCDGFGSFETATSCQDACNAANTGCDPVAPPAPNALLTTVDQAQCPAGYDPLPVGSPADALLISPVTGVAAIEAPVGGETVSVSTAARYTLTHDVIGPQTLTISTTLSAGATIGVNGSFAAFAVDTGTAQQSPVVAGGGNLGDTFASWEIVLDAATTLPAGTTLTLNLLGQDIDVVEATSSVSLTTTLSDGLNASATADLIVYREPVLAGGVVSSSGRFTIDSDAAGDDFDDTTLACGVAAGNDAIFFLANRPAGETVRVRATGVDGEDVILGVQTSCSADPADCLQFADDGLDFDSEELNYTFDETEPADGVMVVVDSFGDAGGSFEIEVEFVSDPFPVAPLAAPICTPDATTCGAGVETVCSSDGTSQESSFCDLGCNAAGDACATIDLADACNNVPEYDMSLVGSRSFVVAMDLLSDDFALPCTGGTGGVDGVFQFTATANETLTIATGVPESRDTVLGVFEATCSTTAAPLACSEDEGPGSTSALTLEVTAGTTYFVVVDLYSDSTSTDPLTVTINR